ncbi:MAG: TrpB-like pyridoxal phosphate-dependent enzyme, partial [Nitriliruptorales bacterium]|nr:TrpB-like pyridoxal phosphate-dependent enzyme [Nitriliruptorales bacterium]
MSNVIVVRTDDGLVMVDSGTSFAAEHVHARVREFSMDPLRLAVFSHGHIDHVFGVGPFDDEATPFGRPAPEVVAHEAMPRRFERYKLTAGWNAAINRRQFGVDELDWPTGYRMPDTLYRDQHEAPVGGDVVRLTHARGETDDHTWTWFPQRRLLCTGDLFIWATPNCGNPQKVQRYAREWAAALRETAELVPEVLLPGHGFPVVGEDRVHEALTNTASLLESLHDQTVALMNDGATLDEILHTVRPPGELMEKPYLQPVYDEPEFIVRNIYREYGGWYNGNPARLKPAPDRDIATEVAILAGGPERLAARARELAVDGRLRLAGHLADWARRAGPDHDEVVAAHAEVFSTLRDEATSTMAKGIFGAAAEGGLTFVAHGARGATSVEGRRDREQCPMTETTKILLDESDMPTRWYNVIPDLPEPPPPPLHPGTKEPAGPDDLAPLFPMALIQQEVTTDKYVDIPDPILDIYRLWRPSPLFRAHRLEGALGTPARIYYKYEGVSPPGSHKPNTAVAQAYYNAEAGIKKLSTETGAGQWGSALAFACSHFDLECEVFMVRISYEQKPYRRSLIQTWGATIHPSPSDLTEAGNKIRSEDPESTGSLGIAISEAVEVAAKNDDTNYSLGSVLNHVLLHQTIIGEEVLKQLDLAGEKAPDVLIGCSGGGSNFGGFALPFLREKLAGKMDPRIVAVEPAASPSFTKGEYRYDFGDTVGMTPLMKMHTLGHDFVPDPIHAGGLRYHGMAPLLSHIYELGLMEA